MSFYEEIEKIEKNVIPEKLNSMYLEMFNILLTIKKEYSEIGTKDYDSFKSIKEKEQYKLLVEEQIKQLENLRKKEKDLIDKEKELESKILNGVRLSTEEENILEQICEKKILISKNISSVIKKISYFNFKSLTLDNERFISENTIEQDRSIIKSKIDELVLILEKIEKNNFGLSRLDKLEVKKHHFNDINEIILGKNYKISDEILRNIDNLFKNSLEIRINIFREIYNEVLVLIESYKKHEDISFDNIEILENLFDSKVGDKPYSIYPYININKDLRHISEYSRIIEEINEVTKGDISEEKIRGLEQKLYYEINSNDMSHNFFS